MLWFKEVGVKYFDVLMCYDSPKMLKKDVNRNHLNQSYSVVRQL